MTYLTHKTTEIAITTRFLAVWAGVYKIVGQNIASSAPPRNDEVWLEFAIEFSGSSGKRVSIGGDYAIERKGGIIKVTAHIPMGTGTATLTDITDLIGKTFSPTVWQVGHLYTHPTQIGPRYETEGGFVGVIRTPFHFDSQSGDVDPSRIVVELASALSVSGSPILTEIP